MTVSGHRKAAFRLAVGVALLPLGACVSPPPPPSFHPLPPVTLRPPPLPPERPDFPVRTVPRPAPEPDEPPRKPDPGPATIVGRKPEPPPLGSDQGGHINWPLPVDGDKCTQAWRLCHVIPSS